MIFDAIEAFVRYGLSWTAVAILLVRNRRLRKFVNRHLPKIMQDRTDSDIAEIKRDVKSIKRHLGVKEEWNVHTSRKENAWEKYLKSLQAGGLFALAAKCITHLKATYQYRRRMKDMQKFKSRKFWMAIISALLVVLNEGLGLGVDSETVLAFAAIVISYIIGESHVDSKKAGVNQVEPDYAKNDDTAA